MATHRTQSLPTTSRPSFVKMSIAPLPAGKRMGEPCRPSPRMRAPFLQAIFLA
jgi:hypothetical protein